MNTLLLVLQATGLNLDQFRLLVTLLGIALFIIILVYVGLSSGKEETE